MFKKGADLPGRERKCEPLHVVLHKHLHRGAVDRTRPFDGYVDTAADRHVCAEQDFRLAIFNFRSGKGAGKRRRRRWVHSIENLKSLRMPVRFL